MSEPFLDFYKDNAISPVRQDVSDLAKHFSRRDHLYRNLGLPPFAFTGANVIEFGPGSGHNALYVAYKNPAQYCLVDGNLTGLEETKLLLHAHLGSPAAHRFHLCNIQNYLPDPPDDSFNIVLCEGVIPHQDDPAAFARHVGSFVSPGGVLVITTADYVSVLPEVLRRLIKCCIVNRSMSVPEQTGVLCRAFERDYAAMPGASRPIEDWVLDTLINPWGVRLFSISEAIDVLGIDFDVYGSSPKFLTDWRWYKDIHGEQAQVNQRAIWQYEEMGIALMDCRRVIDPIGMEKVRPIRLICKELYDRMIEIERGESYLHRAGLADQCEELSQGLIRISELTSDALHEIAGYFRGDLPLTSLRGFTSFFGRAQQYLSFIRRA